MRIRLTSSAGVLFLAHPCANATKNNCSLDHPSNPGNIQFEYLSPCGSEARRDCHAENDCAIPPESAPSSPPVNLELIG